MIEPFKIAVAEEALDDLRRRLGATRWPAGVTDQGGLPLGEVAALVGYWRDAFDWRRQERRLNELRHFRARVGDLRLHFIHERAASDDAVPLLLLHGWPGSFVEMLGLLPLLGEFHVVVPSLPGYGFSDPPTAPGMSNERMADFLAELMTLLGYERFAVQGGDWGAGIATWLARRHPARLLGMHLNYIPGSFAPHVEGDLAPEEEAFLRAPTSGAPRTAPTATYSAPARSRSPTGSPIRPPASPPGSSRSSASGRTRRATCRSTSC